MNRILLFPMVLLIAFAVVAYKAIRAVIRFVCHPVLESHSLRLYFLVCNKIRKAGLKHRVKLKDSQHYSAMMFTERNPKGNRFVYMFAVDGENLLLSKTVWADGLGEDRSKIVQFEQELISGLKRLNYRIQANITALPDGESQFHRNTL